MTKTKLLIGSLSNDLLRSATLTQRGSLKAANVFIKQARRWVEELKNHKIKYYVGEIIADLNKNIL